MLNLIDEYWPVLVVTCPLGGTECSLLPLKCNSKETPRRHYSYKLVPQSSFVLVVENESLAYPLHELHEDSVDVYERNMPLRHKNDRK